MTRAERLHNLLKEIKNREKQPLITIWKEIFEVSDIFEIYENLVYVKKEIDAFELEIKKLNLNNNQQFKNIINALNTIVQFPALNSNIDNQAIMKNEYINILFASFDMFNSFAKAQHVRLENEENVPEDKFENFRESIKQAIDEIEASDIPINDKSIFLSIFHDLNKATSLYKINGLKSFMEVIHNNICKIRMIDESIGKDSSGSYNNFKTLVDKAIKEVWFWVNLYSKLDETAKLTSKTYAYLKEKASELTALSISDKTDDTEADIVEE